MHGLDQLFVKVWIGQFVALAWRGYAGYAKKKHNANSKSFLVGGFNPSEKY